MKASRPKPQRASTDATSATVPAASFSSSTATSAASSVTAAPSAFAAGPYSAFESNWLAPDEWSKINTSGRWKDTGSLCIDSPRNAGTTKSGNVKLVIFDSTGRDYTGIVNADGSSAFRRNPNEHKPLPSLDGDDYADHKVPQQAFFAFLDQIYALFPGHMPERRTAPASLVASDPRGELISGVFAFPTRNPDWLFVIERGTSKVGESYERFRRLPFSIVKGHQLSDMAEVTETDQTPTDHESEDEVLPAPLRAKPARR